MTTKTKIVLGIVGAAAAGVVIGMLLAPETGADMRRKIKDTAGNWGDHLTDLFANAKGEIENLKRKSSRMAEDAADQYNNTKESFS